ncbi:ras guanine nucleotide exchange factor domain-containing protein [Gorgonomyces haynaldii]|nr:ras guanine nucleotide exchange factor domain-containing protein [Gorgonomyces haynaldii]
MGDSSPAQKQQTTLKDDELKILEDQFDQLVFEDQNGKKVVRGGTLHQMVMYITHHQIKDDDFTLALLMTHHSFTTSAELMDLLLKRYEITPPYGLNQRLFEVYLEKKVVPIRLRVCHCLMMWIQNHFEEDFMDNEPLFIRVREFVERKVMYDFENMAPGMLATLEVKLREESKPKYVLKPQYDKQIKNANATKFGMVVEQVFNLNLLQTDPRAFLDIDALEIAKQLTCVEFELFAQVQVYECLDQIWGSRRKKEAMAYREVKKLINHTNQIGLWVASTILATENPKQRLNVIKYFIHLANHCKELNNLTGLTTVLAGLFMGPVERLKKTWQALAEKHPKSMEKLGPLVSAKFQYAQYRKYVKDMSPPAIPFLGVYLTDLTFIEDGNSDFLPDSHLINFDKRNKVYSLITDKVVRFQQVPYDLTPIGQIIDFIKKLSSPSGAVGWEESSPIMTYEELEQLSLQVEPLELESDEDEDDAE